MQAKFNNVYYRPLNAKWTPKPSGNSIQVVFESYEELPPETVLLASTGQRDNLIGLILFKKNGEPYDKEIFVTRAQMLDFVDKFKNAPLNHTITIS